MKSRLLIFLLSIFCLSGRAQNSQMEYRPFAQDGKLWECQVGLIYDNVYDNYVYGDTLIGGETWKKVYNNNYWGDFTDYSDYYAAIRDVDKKVYAIAKGSNRPRLLYDFGLKEGDIVRCGIEGNKFGCILEDGEQPDSLLGFEFEAYLQVNRIDTITEYHEYSEDQVHRVFILTLLDKFHLPLMDVGGEVSIYNNVVWIEGIGSYTGPFSPWMPLHSQNFTSRNCRIGKTDICGYPEDFFEPYYFEWEEDNEDGITVSRNQHVFDRNNALYNLFGLQMTRLPGKGIYIQNGRKFVNK